MRNLVTLVALAVIGFCVWKYYSDQGKGGSHPTSNEAAASGGAAGPAPHQGTHLSPAIGAWYAALVADLNQRTPSDLVPPLTVARQRIAEGKNLVEPEKRAIYDIAVSLLTTMIALAEERTKALEIQMQAAASDKSSLDSKGTAVGSKAFFADSTLRRWNEARAQARPGLDRLLGSLQNAEQAWNAKLPPNSPADGFGLATLEPVMIKIDTRSVSGSSLETSKVNQTRTLYPWRRAYYEQHSRHSP